MVDKIPVKFSIVNKLNIPGYKYLNKSNYNNAFGKYNNIILGKQLYIMSD